MNLNDPKPCRFQHNCHNFLEAKNGNCACEFDDVLDCWVELEPREKRPFRFPRQVSKTEVEVS